MSASELDNRNVALSMRKSVENLVISSQDAIGQSISQALTFSGMITQHNNQIIQENKSVSRSPSPSLRVTDTTGIDQLEYHHDKGSETSLPGLAAASACADTVSVGSATDIAALAGFNIKTDITKSASISPRAAEVASTVQRSKKKSWYNSLYPTYKSKSDDFKRLFKELPDDERLIADYSCALQKDILAHGRLYASQNFLCFYANIFGWETSVSMRWKDVTAITKEKTALVIPNAILVCTEGEKNFLTSFSGRDKAYLMLFRIWQNALMDQPRSSQEIWQWVHSCYGEELGFNSEDEGYSKELFEDVAPALLPDITSEELVDTSSMEASGHDRDVTDSRPPARDASPPLVSNGDARYREEEGGDTLPTDMSDTSDSEADKPRGGGDGEQCTSVHDGKLLLHQNFPFNIDQLFTMIFTNSKFNLELLAARGTTDYVQAPWQPSSGLKCRQVSYRLGLTSGPIGPKEVHVTETQVMNKCSKPGVLYSIDSTSENAGIPYADYFSVEVHYCLQRVSESVTNIALYAQVKYKKTMWPMVKAFLEKNTISGLEEFCRILEARLLREADATHAAARKPRRPRRPPAASQEASCIAAVKSPTAALLARPPVPGDSARGTSWLLGVLLLLLLINALLYWRLYHAERHSGFDLDDLQQRMHAVSGQQMSAWSRLLEQHSVRQRGQLLAWRDALDRAVQHLAQTEQALRKLLETIKPSLEKAQSEGDAARSDL